jgi:hypothetical protein
MPNSRMLMPSSLLNHVTTIKLALELFERESPLSLKQHAFVELAREAADTLAVELASASAPHPSLVSSADG